MKKFTKIMAAFMAVVVLVTAFAACGGNTETQKVKVVDFKLTDEEYAFGVDKNQPELLEQVNAFVKEIKANGELEAICNKYFADGQPTGVKSAKEDSSKDQLVVATNAAFPPFEYTEGDTFYGIDMEIAAALAKKLNKELVIKHMDFDAVCLSVGEHKCDIAMAGLTVNEKREEYVTFSEPYYQASQKLIVKGDDTTFDSCKSAEDVTAILNALDASAKIGGQTGTTGQEYVKGNADFDFAGLKATFVGYKNASLAVNDLLNGNLTYVIVDEAPAKAIADKMNAMA